MAGTTLIDNLLVKLGLDARDFTKGEKEAAAALLDLQNKVKRSTTAQSGEITKLATKWLSIAAAIKLVKASINILDDVAERTRRLGIDSKNYNIAAANIRNFENAVEMMGGNAEDARKSIAGLTQSVFNLAYNGQMSDSLVMLARLGVQFQTATGEARDFNDIVLDTADAIGEAQKNGMSRANAFQYLQQSGFDQGTAQLILSGRAGVQESMAHQGARRQISDSDVDAATGISQSRTGRRQAREGLEVEFMQSPAGKLLEATNQKLEELMTPSGASEAYQNVTGAVTDAMEDLAEKTKHLGDAFDQWALDMGGTTRGLRNNNPGNLMAVGGQNQDRKGFRVFKTMQEGIQADNAQLDKYAKRGIKTLGQIVKTWAPPGANDTKKYIDDMVKETGYGENEEIDSGKRAIFLAAMFKKESGKGAPDSGQVADALNFYPDNALPPSLSGTRATPSPSAAASGQSNVTKVDIDSITVNTQAKDANRIADELGGTLKRKLLASHAEQGMQ